MRSVNVKFTIVEIALLPSQVAAAEARGLSIQSLVEEGVGEIFGHICSDGFVVPFDSIRPKKPARKRTVITGKGKAARRAVARVAAATRAKGNPGTETVPGSKSAQEPGEVVPIETARKGA